MGNARLLTLSSDPETQLDMSSGLDTDVLIPTSNVELTGHLVLPSAAEQTARRIVILAHGAGSTRDSPRNRYVASAFNTAGFGTLLVDLLTPDEEHDRTKVFDVDKLTHRLVDVTKWLTSRPGLGNCRVGYFGSSIGAAAALCAAADPELVIDAVVSRGGRPDLAAPHLYGVHCPTLFIVGADDAVVVDLTQRYQEQLECTNEVRVVPQASHLFEEEGCLEQVALLAQGWFIRHLHSERTTLTTKH
jgi:putative phosphoribosyl transferase